MIFNHDLETVGKLVESWCTMRSVIHHAAGRKDGRRGLVPAGKCSPNVQVFT